MRGDQEHLLCDHPERERQQSGGPAKLAELVTPFSIKTNNIMDEYKHLINIRITMDLCYIQGHLHSHLIKWIKKQIDGMNILLRGHDLFYGHMLTLQSELPPSVFCLSLGVYLRPQVAQQPLDKIIRCATKLAKQTYYILANLLF